MLTFMSGIASSDTNKKDVKVAAKLQQYKVSSLVQRPGVNEGLSSGRKLCPLAHTLAQLLPFNLVCTSLERGSQLRSATLCL